MRVSEVVGVTREADRYLDRLRPRPAPKVVRSQGAATLAGEDERPRILSGAGDDGVLGLMRIKAANGIAIVQLPSEAEIASMPTNALRHDRVDAALTLDAMGPALAALARGKSIEIPISGDGR